MIAEVIKDSRPKGGFWEYVAIARPDHWIKHVMIVPGVVFAWLLGPGEHLAWDKYLVSIACGLAAACLIASANYVINEWLDSEFDAHHPKKKSRPAVRTEMNQAIIILEYLSLVVVGLLLAWQAGKTIAATCAVFALAGLIYNVRPIRTKDLPIFDVISESLNNPLRLLIGWFMVAPAVMPPSSIIIAYWSGGAFLMTVKRLAEFRFLASTPSMEIRNYRPSLARYKESTLLISALIYAQLFAFAMAIFLLKYRIEYSLLFPFLCALFAIYLQQGYVDNSAAQSPEKLFKKPLIMGMAGVIVLLFLALTFVDLPSLAILTDTHFIAVPD